MTDSIKLSGSDFDFDKPISIASFTVTVEPDDCPENPWESWDCEPPILVNDCDRRGSTLSEYGEGQVLDVLWYFSDWQISRHWRAICAALDVSESDHSADFQDRKESCYGAADIRRELFQEYLDGLGHSDKLDALESLYKLVGIPALSTSRSGYSQGDYVEILVVLTPDWCKRVGYRLGHSDEKQMTGAADLYAYWAFGDVYGYSIECELTGEIVDSCGGFYGRAYENDSGIWDSVNDALNAEISERKERKARKVKQLIRARVPLDIRQQIFA